MAPIVLLLPWLSQVVADPSLLLLESGVPLASDDQPPWQVLLLNPGGLTVVPLFLGAGLVLAGVAAVIRVSQLRAVRSALAVAAAGLAWALVLDAITVTPEFSALPVAPWAGTSLVLAAGGLITAAVLAARSTRQPTGAARFVMAATDRCVGDLGGGARLRWPPGSGGCNAVRPVPSSGASANPLPAFVRAQSELPDQIRTLVLKQDNGRLTYTVLRQRAAQFGDVETAPPAERLADLDEVVADLASGRGTAPVDRLAQYAVQYVLAVPPVDPALEIALDSAPGVLRVANPGDSSLWRIERSTGRLRLMDDAGKVTVLPSDPVDTTSPVPAGTGDRLLELSELADDRWRATQDGSQLPSRDVAGWADGFVVSSAASDVTVKFRSPLRITLFVAQGLAWLVVIVLALPSRRRESETAV